MFHPSLTEFQQNMQAVPSVPKIYFVNNDSYFVQSGLGTNFSCFNSVTSWHNNA